MFEENDMHWHTKRASRYKQRVHDKNMKYDSMRLCAAAGCNLDVCFHQEPPGLQKWPRRTRVFLSWLKTDSPLTPMARSQQNHSYHSDVLDVRALFFLTQPSVIEPCLCMSQCSLQTFAAFLVPVSLSTPRHQRFWDNVRVFIKSDNSKPFQKGKTHN